MKPSVCSILDDEPAGDQMFKAIKRAIERSGKH